MYRKIYVALTVAFTISLIVIIELLVRSNNYIVQFIVLYSSACSCVLINACIKLFNCEKNT